MKKGYTYFIRKIYSKKTIQKLENKIMMLGSKSKFSAEKFLLVRLIFSLLILILALLSLQDIFLSLGLTVFYYIGFSYLIDYYLDKRKKELESDALLFFEVLALALESGKDLVSSLEITTDSIHSSLSLEFKQVLYEIKYGKSVKEAFMSFKKRLPSDTLNNVILNMINSYSSGGNLVESLNEQVEYIRSIKKMELKEKINRLPIQISVVSVIFVVPMVLLLILGPVVLEYFLTI